MDNSLAVERPDLAEEWDYERNGDLTPKDVACGSGRKVWWRCKLGHSWEAMIKSRSNGQGCPKCGKKSAAIKQATPKQGESLVDLRPDLVKEWNYERNGNLRPENFKCFSLQRVWWKCSLGHSWEATIASRSNGRGCPECGKQSGAIKRATPKQGESLADLRPDLVREWDYEKNGDLRPENFKCGSNTKVWWKCNRGHEWEATIDHRSKGSGCPECSAKGTSYGEQFIYWALKELHSDIKHRVKLNNIFKDEDLKHLTSEYDIYIPSLKLVIEYSGTIWHQGREDIDNYKKELALSKGLYFLEILEDKTSLLFNEKRIPKIKESYLKIIHYIEYKYAKRGTPIFLDLEKIHKLATEYSKGKVKFEDSLAYLRSDLAKEWNYERNEGLTPKDVTRSSEKKAYWKCPKGHSWEARISTRNQGRGCPYCSGQRVLKGFNDLATTNPQLASEWNYERNGNLTPDKVTISSNKKVWWKCNLGHEWQAIIANRSKGQGCPICAGRKVLKGFNDLATTSPQLASEWNYERNGNLTPEDVTSGPDRKVWWRCKRGHEWEAKVSLRSRGQGCPHCYKESRKSK